MPAADNQNNVSNVPHQVSPCHLASHDDGLSISHDPQALEVAESPSESSADNAVDETWLCHLLPHYRWHPRQNRRSREGDHPTGSQIASTCSSKFCAL